MLLTAYDEHFELHVLACLTITSLYSWLEVKILNLLITKMFDHLSLSFVNESRKMKPYS